MNRDYHGIYAALVTPYTKEGEVNLDELQKLARYLIAQGIDGFYVGGSTSEAFLLSNSERKNILEAVVEANAKQKKIICHVGAISTDQAVDFAKHAQRAGADAISAISPFYYKFSDQEIIRYYTDIMNACSLPMFVYNFPTFSGFSLTENVLGELEKHENLAGVKFTSSDMFLLERIKTNHPGLVVWNGYDEMLAAGLMMGADGGIGSTYNCMCPLIRRIYTAFRAERQTDAHSYQVQANHVIKAIGDHGVFASVKYLLELEGFQCNGCRRPFSPLTKEGKQALESVYEKYILPSR